MIGLLLKTDPTLSYEKKFEKMRVVGKLAAQCLDELKPEVGMSTHDIDAYVRKFAFDHDLYLAQEGYRGFPAACCTSVNHVICHGIPSPKKLLNPGDIVKVDVTFIHEGYHGDTCRTYPIGNKINPKAARLIGVAVEALTRGINAVKPGNRIGDIGQAIEDYVEKGGTGFSIVRDFLGHGIGTEFHTLPHIPHYVDTTIPGFYQCMTPGMTFTIEPMINAGKRGYKTLADGWTVVTRDREFSAQFEHTLGVTEDGVEVFTYGTLVQS